MSAPDAETVLAEVRGRAGRRDWSGVRSFAGHPAMAFSIEFGLLVSEAELRQGESELAKTRLTDLVVAAKQRHSGPAVRRATNMLGAACFERGELVEAESAFEDALAEATRDADYLTAARATNNLGLIANIRGRHETALAMYRVALPAYQRLGFSIGMGETTHNIAITLRDLGQYEEADRYERRAIEFAADASNTRLGAMARTGRAEIGLHRGEAAVAAAEARRALTDYQEIGDQMGEADAHRVLGLGLLALGANAEAGQHIVASLELATRSGASLLQAEALAAHARVALALDDRERAASDVEQAIAAYQALGADGDRAALEHWWEQATG